MQDCHFSTLFRLFLSFLLAQDLKAGEKKRQQRISALEREASSVLNKMAAAVFKRFVRYCINIICIGNHMILSAIWNKLAQVIFFFQRRPKYGLVQFVVSEKIYKCLFIPNCTRKIMRLLIINNTDEKIRDG